MPYLITFVPLTVEYRPWFQAVLSGDWFKAKEFLTLHPTLHNAIYKGHEQIVEELVQLMTEEQLETKNDDGQTAPTIAASKNLKIVKCLVAKNKKLLGIADGRGSTPIVIAAEHDRWDIVEELVQLMTEEQLETKNDDEHAPSVSDARINVQNQENEQGDQRNSTGMNRDLKLLHVRSLKILNGTCEEIKHLNNEEMMRYKLYETVFNAVENGIVEIVISLCKAKPELLVRKRRREGPNQESIFQESIFHYAVECRQEKVYSLKYGAGKRNYLATLKNSRVERMLYYAGMSSPLAKEKLDCIPGAALQMQRERQWYKVRIILYYFLYSTSRNSNGNSGSCPSLTRILD
ncbi:unnamed protein product [Malus baccata var. baccata]